MDVGQALRGGALGLPGGDLVTWVRSVLIGAMCAGILVLMPMAMGWWGVGIDCLWLGAAIKADWKRGRA